MHENRETSETPAAQPGRRTAGEGSGRTARMHVTEESDSGVVPMNHSNNDGKPPAESEEGRLLIKENTLRPSTYPTQSGFFACSTGRWVCGQQCASRQSSEIRAVCANERLYGSGRGAISNGRPYRDLTSPRSSRPAPAPLGGRTRKRDPVSVRASNPPLNLGCATANDPERRADSVFTWTPGSFRLVFGNAFWGSLPLPPSTTGLKARPCLTLLVLLG